ncbi:hypothetical protein PCIT_a3384 [Pseudoalteromonas citrea]|uniref:Uncharacterized protein n=1 Tax=Pseudoalteromonas citrea TaxID=43655 RepID=A0AAD4AH38_9GAMM|nr:hypothetical protein PCIT_a3384 [Pseudoalteromonas citrea]
MFLIVFFLILFSFLLFLYYLIRYENFHTQVHKVPIKMT